MVERSPNIKQCEEKATIQMSSVGSSRPLSQATGLDIQRPRCDSSSRHSDGLLQFSQVNICEGSPVTVLPSCALLRSLRTLKITCPPFDERRPVPW